MPVIAWSQCQEDITEEQQVPDGKYSPLVSGVAFTTGEEGQKGDQAQEGGQDSGRVCH